MTLADSFPWSSSTNDPIWPAALPFHIFPAIGIERLDLDRDLIETRPADPRVDLARRNLQIHHRSIANVGAAPWQAIAQIAVSFQVVAPGLAPERCRDLAAFRFDGGCLAALGFELGKLPRRLGLSLGNTDVGFKAAIPPHKDIPFPRLYSPTALLMSRATNFNR